MALNFGSETNTEVNNNQSNQNTGVKMNLTKVTAGQRINLTKEVGSNVTQYCVGLNWNTKPGVTADLDVSILLLAEDGKVIKGSNGDNAPKCLVYYGQLELPGIKSYGDNKTGTDSETSNSSGSDEQIDIDLSKIEENVDQVVVIATTHSQENDQPGPPIHFGRVSYPVLDVFDSTNKNELKKIITFELDEEASTATSVEVAKFYKKGDTWRFVSQADFVGDNPYGLQGVLDRYNIVS